MTVTFRLMTPEEQLAPSMFEEHYPDPKKYRWHCSTCGRMVKFATVKKVQPHGPDFIDEHEYTGECKAHGRVDVVWPEQ